MKKRIIFNTLLLTVIVLSACSNSDDNLIDTSSLNEGTWVTYDGEVVENDEMRSTEPIDYDPSKSYEINRSSYVSYYNGDEFIETIQYSDDPPMTVDTVEEADSIVVSFNQYNEDTINLTEAE
ncbi:hypothetical protein [Jeotgalicoccus marinus]|uniref:hypothetical protein n=1 Tax=Jeotgalicoccus marinus TaxID=516700 RepID=UPI00047CC0A2|nr:hypothetical protein [Jeotgalicoccus marinus]